MDSSLFCPILQAGNQRRTTSSFQKPSGTVVNYTDNPIFFKTGYSDYVNDSIIELAGGVEPGRLFPDRAGFAVADRFTVELHHRDDFLARTRNPDLVGV